MPLDFGIGEALALALGGGAFAEAAAPIIVAGVEGAGLGAAGSAITGGKPAQGALFGGLGGALTAGAGELLGGVGGVAGDTASQAAALADPASSFGALPAGSLSGADLFTGGFGAGAFDAAGSAGSVGANFGNVAGLTGNFAGAVDPTGTQFGNVAGGGSFSGGGETASFIPSDTAAQATALADPASSFGALAPGSLAGADLSIAGDIGGAVGGDVASGLASAGGTLSDLGGGATAPIAAPPPVTPFTQAAQGIPTFGGSGGDIATSAGAPQATLASLGGGAGPGSTAGGTAAFSPPAALGGGGPGALDFTAATQGTPGSLFSGASDTATSLAPGATDTGGGLVDVGGTAPINPQQIASDFGATFGNDTGLPTDVVPPVPPEGGPPGLLQRIGGSLASIPGKIGTSLENAASDPLKLAGLAITGGGLLKDLAAPQQIPGIPQLTNLSNTTGAQGQSLIGQGLGQQSAPRAGATDLATSAVSQGQSLASHLENGTLPPGVQGAIDQASNAAIQTIKGQYASRGMSGSSSELQDINAVKARAVTQGTQIALQLQQQGLGFEQLGANLYNSLIGQSNNLLQVGASLTGQSGNQLNGLIAANVAQSNQVNTAIGNLGRALAGGNVTNNTTNVAA
jgi:hypothetical protein